MTALDKVEGSLVGLTRRVTQVFFQLSHNGFALLGLGVMFAIIALIAQPELRKASEAYLMGWLQDRQVETLGYEEDAGAIDRTTAANPHELPKQQAAVAFWLSKKYRVAPEPLSALVTEAYDLGTRVQLDPTLILAIMAIESGFNPFAQSAVGAQGLMQVMTKVHTDKFAGFGGKLAAFDPVANLRVGVKVLQECIQRAGSIERGLRAYVGATSLEDDGGYTAKVLAEHERLQQVAAGRHVPLINPQVIPTVSPAKAAASADNVALLNNY
jgi:hypothetical protein